jgi:tRNA threonylcarbamoyladenosine biosynthesis protein TsaE
VTDPKRQKNARRKPEGPARPDDGRRSLYSLSEDETFEIGRTLGRGLRPGALILLQGELGLGKTVLARGIAAGLGVAPEEVSSPSFTLVHEYRGGRLPVFHIDLYRVERMEEELPSLGIEDILAGGGVAVVEWGERLPPYLRRGAIVVRFVDLREGCRRIEIVPEPEKRTRTRGDA